LWASNQGILSFGILLATVDSLRNPVMINKTMLYDLLGLQTFLFYRSWRGSTAACYNATWSRPIIMISVLPRCLFLSRISTLGKIANGGFILNPGKLRKARFETWEKCNASLIKT
jgi:hypothetical protein